MYKTVFQNSKAALIFAGMTIFGAVVMIGSPEDKGVVTGAVDLIDDQRTTIVSEAESFAQSQSVPDAPSYSTAKPEDEIGSSFGDFTPEGTATNNPHQWEGYPSTPTPTTPPAAPQVYKPGRQPVVADNQGTPVPGKDNDPPLGGPPVITSRQMTIQPN
jgi:hypothetical protein